MTRRGTLSRIKPKHADLVPPKGAVRIDTTPDNRPVYRLVHKRTRAVPLLDDEGEQVYVTSRLNGENVYKRNRAEPWNDVREFYLESDGQLNVYMIPYKAPTREEIEAAAREGKVEEFMRELAETFVDSGMSPKELLASALANADARAGREPTGLEGVEDAGEADEEFPKKAGVALWELSDGTKIRGAKTDAIEKQAELTVAATADGAY